MRSSRPSARARHPRTCEPSARRPSWSTIEPTTRRPARSSCRRILLPATTISTRKAPRAALRPGAARWFSLPHDELWPGWLWFAGRDSDDGRQQERQRGGDDQSDLSPGGRGNQSPEQRTEAKADRDGAGTEAEDGGLDDRRRLEADHLRLQFQRRLGRRWLRSGGWGICFLSWGDH